MPAAAIVLPLAETFFGGAISTAVGGALASAGLIEAGTTIGSIVTGVIVGAGEGAISAAIQGGDISKGALGGLVGGGVGAGVSGALGNALIPKGMQGPGLLPEIGGSVPAGVAAQRGLSQLAGGVAGGLAAGQPFDRALRGAIPGALGGALSGVAQYGLGLQPTAAQLAGQAASQLAKYQLQPQPTYPTFKAPEPTVRGAAPSATLGQSLSVAPSLGYSPGLTVFGSGGEGDKPKRPVWNVASLRNVGESEA